MDPRGLNDNVVMQQRAQRYSIERPVEFHVRGQGTTRNGAGRTLNISRGGVLFQTDSQLPVGRKIELVVDLGDALGGPPVTLNVQGVVLRNQSGGAVAVLIRKYRLRPIEEAAPVS